MAGGKTKEAASQTMSSLPPSEVLTLLQFPAEVVSMVIRQMDRSTLAKTSCTCKALRSLAQPVLFEAVVVDRLSAPRLFHDGTDLSHTTATLIAANTIHLELIEDDEEGPFTSLEDEVHQNRLLAGLQACEVKRLKTFEIMFRDGEPTLHPTFQQMVGRVLRESQFCCETVYLGECSWSFVHTVLVQMQSSLRKLEWYFGVKDADTAATPSWPLGLSLPVLQHIIIDLYNADFVPQQWLQDLLKTVAPRIQTLELGALNWRRKRMSWDLEDAVFPELLEFSFRTMSSGLYTSIVSQAPKLSYLSPELLLDYNKELLDTVPVSVEILACVNMQYSREPPHTILPQLKRLTNLKELPHLVYADVPWVPEEYKKVEASRAEILSYFITHGIDCPEHVMCLPPGHMYDIPVQVGRL